MKAGTHNMIKFKRLQRCLKLPLWQAVGLLEALWQLTAKDTPRGDIGRFSDEDIAAWLEYDGDATELVDSFVSSGWIDRSDEFRLIVHDWHDHAPNYVRGNVARHTDGFVTSLPRDTPQDDVSEPPLGTVPPSLVKPSQVKSSLGKRGEDTPARPVFELPKVLDVPGFHQSWRDFNAHCIAKGSPLTDEQKAAYVDELKNSGIQKAIADLRFSVRVGAKTLRDSADDYSKLNGRGEAVRPEPVGPRKPDDELQRNMIRARIVKDPRAAGWTDERIADAIETEMTGH